MKPIYNKGDLVEVRNNVNLDGVKPLKVLKIEQVLKEGYMPANSSNIYPFEMFEEATKKVNLNLHENKELAAAIGYWMVLNEISIPIVNKYDAEDLELVGVNRDYFLVRIHEKDDTGFPSYRIIERKFATLSEIPDEVILAYENIAVK